MCPSYLATGTRRTRPAAAPGCCRRWPTARWCRRLGVAGGARVARPVPVLQGVLVATARPAWTWPQYKSEVLHRTYRGRLRPPSHYALGWLPRWARLAARGSRAGQRGARASAAGRAGWRMRPAAWTRAASHPRVRRARPFRAGGAGRPRRRGAPRASRRCALDRLVLRQLRRRPSPAPRSPCWRPPATRSGPADDACCGLTWISTGQLDGAREQLAHLLGVLGAVRGRTASRSSAWSRRARRCCARDLPTCCRTTRARVAVAARDPHARRAADAPHRSARRAGRRPDLAGVRRRRPAALPPPRRDGLAAGRGAARAGRRAFTRWAAAAAWPATSAWKGPLRRLGRGGRERPAARAAATPAPATSAWPTASPAARRPTSSPAVQGVHLAELLASRLTPA